MNTYPSSKSSLSKKKHLRQLLGTSTYPIILPPHLIFGKKPTIRPEDLLFDALATTPGRHLVHQLDPLPMYLANLLCFKTTSNFFSGKLRDFWCSGGKRAPKKNEHACFKCSSQFSIIWLLWGIHSSHFRCVNFATPDGF